MRGGAPRTSRRRPWGGCFLSSTSSTCRMVLEKRGPMGTYSSSRSRSSSTMMDIGDYMHWEKSSAPPRREATPLQIIDLEHLVKVSSNLGRTAASNLL